MEHGDFQGAIEDASASLRQDGRIVRAYAVRGESYFKSGDALAAVSDYDEFLKQEPENAMVLWKRSRARLDLPVGVLLKQILQDIGQLDGAIEDSQAALRGRDLTEKIRADCWLVTALAKMPHVVSLPLQWHLVTGAFTMRQALRCSFPWLPYALAGPAAPSSSHPAFDQSERQVNKEHIGDGLTLADDPEFAKKPDAATALADPGCDDAPGWAEYRSQLMALAAVDWQDAAALAFDWMNARDMMKTKIMDEEAKVCLLGVISSIYMLARWSLEVDDSWESAVYLTRTLSGYASSMHPGKLDQITLDGQRWPVTVKDLDSMRRSLARQSAHRTTSSWTNRGGDSYVGNAFGIMGTDQVEPGISIKDSMRVYVYDVEDYPELAVLAQGAAFCRENQWGFEVSLHEWFLACPCRTDNPHEADFFFVPHYTACHLNVETFTEEESDSLFQSLIQRLEHFQRSQGRDHLFSWGGGFGADGPFRSWRRYIEDSIFLMTETELWNPYHNITTPSFNPWKDAREMPGKWWVHRVWGDDARYV
eukprot:symbB.v1.2.010868.t2/scaffold716.1/size187362/21